MLSMTKAYLASEIAAVRSGDSFGDSVKTRWDRINAQCGTIEGGE